MRVLFRPEAGTEALDAQRWYEARLPDLGMDFARSLEAAVSAIQRDPLAFALLPEGNCRRVLLRRFPYSVIYRARPDDILVVAVFHHRRSPLRLRGRVRSPAP